MAIDYDQMRDCLLDALSQHVLSLDDHRAEVVISGVALKAATRASAGMRGLLVSAGFDQAENKLFEQALWTLFSEGTLAPLFRSQRYGKNGWEEGEFKLTARGLRGFRGSSPGQDLDAYLASLRFACTGLAGCLAVVAYAEQAVRALRAELLLAAAVMVETAGQAAVAELATAYAGAGAPAGLRLADLVAWLVERTARDPELAGALAAAPEVSDGLQPLVAAAQTVAAAHAGPVTPKAIEAALAALPACVERAGLLTRLFKAQPARS